MRKFLLTGLVVSFLGVAGCTDAQQAKREAYGYENVIIRYSGGKRVEEYVSTGRVETEEHSDGWFFREKHTGKAIRISGGVTIRMYDPATEVFETELAKKWYGGNR